MTPDIKYRYLHFIQRVKERVGEDVDAHALWDGLSRAIEANEQTVQFITRLKKPSRRIWKFELGGNPFFAVYDHDMECLVTVLEPSGHVWRPGNVHVDLEDYI